MVRGLYQNKDQRWLEPGCGKGVFVTAISALGVEKSMIDAVDLDQSREEADQFANVCRNKDFLVWSRSCQARYDCVVGNPPYIPIKALSEPLRSTAANILDLDGGRMGLRGNIWYAFLLQSIRLLRQGGSLSFILPAACEFSDYSTQARSRLASMFHRVDVIRSKMPFFKGVQEGCVVLICQKKDFGPGYYRRHYLYNPKDVIDRIVSLSAYKARACPRPYSQQESTKLVSDIANIRLGGVTGDSRFFVLSEARRNELGLPRSAVTPIVSRSTHIQTAAIDMTSWYRLLEKDERIWLFYPKDLRSRYVRCYLDLPLEAGGCNRNAYKIKNRDPWYKVPLPNQADAFISGMNSTGVWFCMNEFGNLTATNTLYVITFKPGISRPAKYAWALSMLTTPVRQQVSRQQRLYALGLRKLEPGQIAKLRLPVPTKIKGAISTYRLAVDLIINGTPNKARQLADSFILGDTK